MANPSLLNRSAVKRRLLDAADRKWPGKFTRVSKNAVDDIEVATAAAIDQFIKDHPTIGKTLMSGSKLPDNEA